MADTNYIHDDNSYEEIGELHTNFSHPVIGHIESRYAKNKKISSLSPDSDRIIYEHFKDTLIRDVSVFEASNIRDEKQLYLGENFLAVYDKTKGQFFCDNIKNTLSFLKRPTTENGLDLNEEEFRLVCRNLKYSVAVGDWAFIFSQANSKNYMFIFNPYTYELRNYHPSNFTLTGDLLCKPFIINETKVIIPYTNESGSYVFGIDTYFESMNEQEEEFKGKLDNASLDNVCIFNEDSKKRIWFIYVDGTSATYNYADNEWTTVSAQALATGAELYTPGTSIKLHIFDEHVVSNPQNRGFIVYIDDNENIVAHRKIETGVIERMVITPPDDEIIWKALFKVEKGSGTFYVIDSKNNMYEVPTSSITELHVCKPITSFTQVSKSSSIMNVILSKGINARGNVVTDSSSIIYGSYTENGREKPLIKDVANFTGTDRMSKPNRNGLESDTGISMVKGVPFGNTRITRVRLAPEKLLTGTAYEDDTQIYFREKDDVGAEEDRKFTSGDFIWKAFVQSGIPYNTHVRTIGRVIIDGIDIPIETVMITHPDEGKEVGSILFTFDKFFDLAALGTKFAYLEKNVYPGILFKNNAGFLDTAIISNDIKNTNSFSYNDTDQGKLLLGNTANVKLPIAIETSCICYGTFMKGAELIKAAFIGTKGGQVVSVNTVTGGYTRNGVSIGDDAPGVYIDNGVSSSGIFHMEFYRSNIFVFYNDGSIKKIDLVGNKVDNITGSLNQNQRHVAKRLNSTILISDRNVIKFFDLDNEKFVGSELIEEIPVPNSNITFVNGDIYYISSGDLCRFNTFTKISKNYGSCGYEEHVALAYDGNDRVYIVHSSGIKYYELSTGKFVQSMVMTLDNDVTNAVYTDGKLYFLAGNIMSWKIGDTQPSSEENDVSFLSSAIINGFTYNFSENTILNSRKILNVDVEVSNTIDKIEMFDEESNVITTFGVTSDCLTVLATSETGEIRSCIIPYNNKATNVFSAKNEASYEIDFDDTENFPNTLFCARNTSYTWAKAGEILSEGAELIEQVGNDVIFSTPTQAARWSREVGVFFKSNEKKYVETNKDGKTPVFNVTGNTRLPIIDSGTCNIGKYILYFGGWNPNAPAAQTTVHNGAYVYDTETKEFATLLESKDNLHGLIESIIKPFVFADTDNRYIYIFGGLKRFDEVSQGDNVSSLRRTNIIERYDLATGKMAIMTTRYGDTPGLSPEDENFTNKIRVSPEGKREIRYLCKIGNTLKGYIYIPDRDSETYSESVSKDYSFEFNLNAGEGTLTENTKTDVTATLLTSTGLEIDITGTKEALEYNGVTYKNAILPPLDIPEYDVTLLGGLVDIDSKCCLRIDAYSTDLETSRGSVVFPFEWTAHSDVELLSWYEIQDDIYFSGGSLKINPEKTDALYEKHLNMFEKPVVDSTTNNENIRVENKDSIVYSNDIYNVSLDTASKELVINAFEDVI